MRPWLTFLDSRKQRAMGLYVRIEVDDIRKIVVTDHVELVEIHLDTLQHHEPRSLYADVSDQL